MAKVGIYLGSNSDHISNINNVLKTWVQALSQANHDTDLIGGSEIPESVQMDSRIHPVSTARSPTPFGKIKDSYTHVSHYILDHDPDVVIQLWKYQTHGLGVAAAGKRHHVPAIIRFSGDVFNEYRGYELPYSPAVFLLDNIIGSIPLFLSDKVVSLGPNLKQSIKTRGVSNSNIHLIPPPQPDKSRFFPADDVAAVRANLDLKTDRPIALFVGRLSRQKGMSFLERVIERVLVKTDFQFVVVGKGPYREIFKNRFSSEDVVLPGYVAREQIGDYYRAASVYVHPSQFEGIPLVILEALQSELPVVARDAGDISFVVEETVQTEEQMANRLVRKEWDGTWKNRGLFSSEYQKREIARLIKDVTM
ncbi:glycosyltransferase family 4 protein [Natronosalvus rutilus]|uniref:Glycosyltransferase family 4 protein n=1 Tax=Natronosalvus rutilus TaxID=2953753 RepID=A0A9E7ND73_9EURY|nr:glycosyltransferase family 4 protein [Natronosalvus rutilus]UTF54799.1 glycosyltransferase family 4 protein [Natronosalvus rutilus]